MGCGRSSARFAAEPRTSSEGEGEQLRLEDVTALEVRVVSVKDLERVVDQRLSPVVLVTWTGIKSRSKVALHGGANARIDHQVEFPLGDGGRLLDATVVQTFLDQPLKVSVAHSAEDGTGSKIIIGSATLVLAGSKAVQMPAGLNQWLALKLDADSSTHRGMVHVRVKCIGGTGPKVRELDAVIAAPASVDAAPMDHYQFGDLLGPLQQLPTDEEKFALLARFPLHVQWRSEQVATVVRALEHNHMKIRAVAMLAERAIDPRDFCLVLDAVSDKRDRELLQQAMSGTMGKRLLRELANGTKVLHNGQAVMPAKSLMAPY